MNANGDSKLLSLSCKLDWKLLCSVRAFWFYCANKHLASVCHFCCVTVSSTQKSDHYEIDYDINYYASCIWWFLQGPSDSTSLQISYILFSILSFSTIFKSLNSFSKFQLFSYFWKGLRNFFKYSSNNKNIWSYKENHTYGNITKISENAEESAGVMRRLCVSGFPVKAARYNCCRIWTEIVIIIPSFY